MIVLVVLKAGGLKAHSHTQTHRNAEIIHTPDGSKGSYTQSAHTDVRAHSHRTANAHTS